MANPPIVIGTFDNVPAPGSPIKSDWPQEISQFVTDWQAVTAANQAAIAELQAKRGVERSTTNQICTGGATTKLIWTGSGADPDGYVLNSQQIKVPTGKQAIYAITAKLAFSPAPSANVALTFIAGGQNYSGPTFPNGADAFITLTIPLAAGAIVDLNIWNAGSTFNCAGYWNFYRVGPY